jgi:hypothetical protein
LGRLFKRFGAKRHKYEGEPVDSGAEEYLVDEGSLSGLEQSDIIKKRCEGI